ncbi:hypothetical protein PLESTB_000018300 [Pleodorina starrii]|uniref:Uncharacterized protein n=1 Tax=Pleodorina starrii TaxID=330485 RepID=A0A9W6B8D9_9CHLO|nr:hypothetical protein PLESTB_000018300 [Pleodorina starrii]
MCLLATNAARMEAANPSLHHCGCRCKRCREARRLAQQRPRSIDMSWCITRTNNGSSARSLASSSDTSSASCGRADTTSNLTSDGDTRASTSTRSSSENSSPADASFSDVPPLDPNNKPEGARLLSEVSYPDNRSVWYLPALQGWQQELVVKCVPCHSSERAAEIAVLSQDLFNPANGVVSDIMTVEEAQAEAHMALAVSRAGAKSRTDRLPYPHRDLFVQPLHVEVRPCSLVGTSLDAGHDLEVVMVYPYRCVS